MKDDKSTFQEGVDKAKEKTQKSREKQDKIEEIKQSRGLKQLGLWLSFYWYSFVVGTIKAFLACIFLGVMGRLIWELWMMIFNVSL